MHTHISQTLTFLDKRHSIVKFMMKQKQMQKKKSPNNIEPSPQVHLKEFR